MKLLLKEFQEDAVVNLVRNLRAAAKESKRDRQAVVLSSPTGSGKTVMMTRAVEILLEGDTDNAPMSDAVFLWITDQPELNEQTRKKMLATSTVLNDDNLVVIDSTFKEEMLRSGCLHFLNVQKLGRDKSLLTKSDQRDYTIWEVIKNTIDAKPGKFFLIIDEAHRGMTEGRGQAEATTIIQKFIKGSPGEVQPVPLVVGVSATPERFNKLIAGTGRHTKPVDIDVQDVRASGLIKEALVLFHPKKEQPTDMTMLREAARSLKNYTKHWSEHCSAHEDVEIVPLLVVQVEDARNKHETSETDIAEAMAMIRDVMGTMPNDAFAHAFQEGTSIKVGGEDLRYVAPSDIQDDLDLRVVFFKTSLNTGWDCPRAEVMMSFRVAADVTFIAQLVGRMVRTPLARRIVDNEVLNTVSLYLPHYDSKGVASVINRLSKPDDDMAPITVEDGDDVVELHKAKGTEAIFEALSALPSYHVPRRRKTSQIRRVMKFARLLMNDEIDEDAPDTARQELLAVLIHEFNAVKGTDRFKEIVEDRAKIEIGAVNWDVGTDVIRDGDTLKVDIASENVDDLFGGVGRKLNSELHKEWLKRRVNIDKMKPETAKLELFALCINPEVIAKLESRANKLVQEWVKKHKKAMGQQGESSQTGYTEVMNLTEKAELREIQYPATIRGKVSDQPLKKHVYVTDENLFPGDLNGPEERIIGEELQKKEVVAWLRNMDRKEWALTIPYEVDGEERAMYPDFLVVRRVNNELVVDIIDPHSIGLADAPAKAAGIAKFAAQHADAFGRIELILLDGAKEKRLDLTNESVRNKVRAVNTIEFLRSLMD
jgi:type III restriction enzyme